MKLVGRAHGRLVSLIVAKELKRLQSHLACLDQFIRSHVSRLLKSDLVAVLTELQRQEQVFLYMKVRHFFSHFVCVVRKCWKKKKEKKKICIYIYIKWVYWGPQKVEGNKISCSLVELQSFLCFRKLKQSVTEPIGYAMPFMLFGGVAVFPAGYV
jgi:hypothetical protein